MTDDPIALIETKLAAVGQAPVVLTLYRKDGDGYVRHVIGLATDSPLLEQGRTVTLTEESMFIQPGDYIIGSVIRKE